MARRYVHRFTFMLLAVCACNLAGCGNNAPAAMGSSDVDPSPNAPTLNQKFATRNPRVCTQLMTPPTPAQAKELVQCNYEANSILDGYGAALKLVTDVQVRMSPPRHATAGDGGANSVDFNAPIYDLRGQATLWDCGVIQGQGGIYLPGANCNREEAVPKGIGQCWRTSFGDWQCSMTVGGGAPTNHVSGPLTF